MRSVTLVRALGVATLALFFVGGFTPLPTRLYERLMVPPRIGPADAIVVMAAGGPSLDGRLPDDSRRRAAYGIDLYRDGLAPLLVLSGAGGRRSESAARAALAGQCGVPEAAILAVAAGYTTHQEITSLAPQLRARGVRRVLLVTDASHIRRAMRLLEHERFDVLPAPVRAMDAPTKPGERVRMLHETLRESLALVYYAVAGYR